MSNGDPVALLLADDDASLRLLFATLATQAVEGLAVLEAADGLHAIEIALERQPQLALLDVQMPLLDGIDTAIALREAQPNLTLALFTAEPDAHSRRAQEHGFRLFDKLDLDGLARWLELAQPRSQPFSDARAA